MLWRDDFKLQKSEEFTVGQICKLHTKHAALSSLPFHSYYEIKHCRGELFAHLMFTQDASHCSNSIFPVGYIKPIIPAHTSRHAAPIHVEAHVHTVCVHVFIVHMLVVREELHKASRLHPWVHTWTGTTQACVEHPQGKVCSVQLHPLMTTATCQEIIYSMKQQVPPLCHLCFEATRISK